MNADTRPGGLPTFLIIGAPKCGTTSLYRYLAQHPDVFMPKLKEPMFFSYDGLDVFFGGPVDDSKNVVTDLETYRALFAPATSETARGEASPSYLYRERAPERIKHHVPDARLIALLRDPVDRAWSSYVHLRREGQEPLDDFWAAVAAEDRRVEENWIPLFHYTRVGMYGSHLDRYHRLFAPEQIKVYLYDDLAKDPLGVTRDALSFIGVNEAFDPDVAEHHNVSGVPRSRALHELLFRPPAPVRALARKLVPENARGRLHSRLNRRNLAPPPPRPPDLRERLVPVFRADIERVQEILARDLSGWLSTAVRPSATRPG